MAIFNTIPPILLDFVPERRRFELHRGKLSRVNPYVFHAGRWQYSTQFNTNHTPVLGMRE